jgi:hypothetical protein
VLISSPKKVKMKSTAGNQTRTAEAPGKKLSNHRGSRASGDLVFEVMRAKRALL